MNNELYHYGVPGMKWGIIRSELKNSQNKRLETKALKYDKKASKASIKAHKAHAKYDLQGYGNKKTYQSI